ncbi:MAG: hypothetical protein ACI8WB_001857, partial [Phenylobacterium sp.]
GNKWLRSLRLPQSHRERRGNAEEEKAFFDLLP